MNHFYKKILAFQHKTNDYIDDHSHHVAQSLKQAVQRLEDDVQVGKNVHSIDADLKQVISLLEKAQDNEVMSHHHTLELLRLSENFREEARKIK